VPQRDFQIPSAQPRVLARDSLGAPGVLSGDRVDDLVMLLERHAQGRSKTLGDMEQDML
jgi:hypothetical protein